MALAAHSSTIKVPGSPVTFTGEATTAYVAGDWTPPGFTAAVYQINTTAKRVLDPTASVTVRDGVTVLTLGTDYVIDPLYGRIALAAAPGGAITVDGTYLPLASVAEVREFGVKASVTSLDRTTFDDVGNRTHKRGLGDFTATLTALADGGLTLGGNVLIEIRPGGTGAYWRGWATLESLDEKAAVDGLVEYSYSALCTNLGAYFANAFGFGT